MKPNTAGRGPLARSGATGRPPPIHLGPSDPGLSDPRPVDAFRGDSFREDPSCADPGVFSSARAAAPDQDVAPHAPAEAPAPGVHALPAGTLIYTRDGALPVQHLCPGDGVISRDAGMVPLEGLRAGERRVAMVRVAAHAFGRGRPERDCLLPADLPLLLRDWRALSLSGRPRALLPAGRLVDGEGVQEAGLLRLRLFEPVLAAPHVIFAEGLEVACGGEALRRAA